MTLESVNCFQFFENAWEPVCWFDRHGVIIYANRAAAGTFGYTGEQLLSLKLTDIDANLTADKLPELIRNLTRAGGRHYETICQRQDGSRFPASISFSPAREGDEISVCAFIRNVSKDREVEVRQEYLQFAVENAHDAFFLSTADGRIIHVNQSACETLGYCYAELTALKTRDIDPGEIIDKDGSVSINGVPLNSNQGVFESRHRRKDGSFIPVEVTYNNIIFDGIEYSFAFARDITERKEYERQREELRFVFDHAVDAIYIYDKDGRIRYANKSAYEDLGYTEQELLELSVLDLNPNITPEIWKDGWEQATAGNDLYLETIHQRKDGTTFPVEITAVITSIEGVEYASAFVRDITERKRVSQEAEELRFVVEKSLDHVFIYDSNGRFHYVNESACRALGYSREELLGMSIFDIDPRSDEQVFKENLRRRRLGESSKLESVHKTRDGKLIPVEISVSTTLIDGSDYSCAFVRDITDRKAAMQKLEMLQFAVENSIVPFYFYDDKANITYANQSACRALGYSLDELTGLTVHDIDPSVTPEIWKTLYPNVKAGLAGTIPSANRRKDGTIFPVEVTPTNMTFGELEFGVSVNLDISDRVAAEKTIRESEEKFRLIADTSPVALIIHRVSDGTILYANRTAASLFNRDQSGMTGHTVTSLFDNDESRDEFIEILTKNEEVRGHELMLGNRDSNTLWVSLNAKTITMQGELVICSAMLDITEAHNLSLQLSYHAAYDSLTGLVNRREFEARLTRVIKSLESRKTENALCYLDLDQFKVINDTCGHIAGDELLRQLGQVLQPHIRKRDTLARLGGDEFAVLLENCSLQQAKRAANAIREAVRDFRFLWENKTFNIGVSVGLVPIDRSDEDITEVMRRADTACYQAKENGRNRIHVYHAADEELTQRHGEMQWVARITSALEHNRFQVCSQKILSIRKPDARKEHYELLVRMIDEDGEIVPPGAFLPAAERYNLVSRIDRWVIMNTLQWFTHHPQQYKKLKMCSFNLSGQSLNEEDFFQEIIASFRKCKLTPDKFCFEITETAAISNLNSATQFIHALKKLGCRIALDDFGSGLSSFAYLKNLPVDYIKIDGMFIKDLHVDPMHLAMVKSINEVGHVMGKKTIAEFVENKKVLKKLRKLGVDLAQGYGIAKPEVMFDGVSDVLIVN